MSEFSLTSVIVKNSISQNWNEAKLEWELDHIYDVEEPETCECKHYPIREICVIRNLKNGKMLNVGNQCVKKFLKLSSDKIFRAKKKVEKNIEKSFNEETVNLCFKKKVINDWEKNFYLDTMRKTNPSEKVLLNRIKINKKILQFLTPQISIPPAL